MQVTVRDFDVDMDFGNNGITLEIRDNDANFLGKLRIGKATVEWCRGRTRIGNGKTMRLTELVELLDR